jgi:Zn-finger nucleic acid-binding protein
VDIFKYKNIQNMKCPNCNETLLMTARNQIEIDYCPQCRGVWLDKGELDKMLEYVSQHSSFKDHNQQGFGKPGPYDPYGKHQHGHNRPHKKKSFLGDLFDFD